MNSISWDNTSYKIGGKSQFLISGEFHYFRVPRGNWKERLQLFKDAGGNCIATYIPWILHEPVEGDIRFGDIPERDLEGFLKLCREMDIFVICRPGPYQYSEMKYDGLPGWLCESYPEILATDIHGKPFRKGSVSYLHPVFLKKTRTWFDTVCPILSKYLISRNGAVAFVQFDNELMGVHEWFSGLDYNPAAMGFGSENGRYPSYLKDKYKNISKLNSTYGTSFGSFKDVTPMDPSAVAKPGDYIRVKDYQHFYFSVTADYAALLAGWMRQLGIDCDLVHNSANPNMNPYFLETVRKLGKNFLLGSDHYYNLDMDWEGNNPTPKYAVKVFYSNEMLRLMGFPPTVFELPGGSCSEWPPITPEDLMCCYMTNIALGAKGVNYYIFTGGPNPENIGSNGDSYDYGAPVGADGSIRPHYYTQKEFHSFLHDHSWLANAHSISDFNIGLDWEQSRSRNFSSTGNMLTFSSADAWSFLQKGFVITSFCSSRCPSLIDLQDEKMLNLTDKPLLIASSDIMPAEIQNHLVRFVENGGYLLISPVIPYLDENFKPCTILKDYLGCQKTEKCKETFPRVNVGPVQNVLANIKLFVSATNPENSSVLAIEENSCAIAGWKKQVPGAGTVIWLGLSWKYSKKEHARMFQYILEELKCKNPVVDSNNPNIWTVLRSDGQNHTLFAMNLLTSPMCVNIKVNLPNAGIIDAGEHNLRPMEVITIKL